MGNCLAISGEQWLTELFEFEFCAECGGDACHHTAVPDVMGNWFARCDYPPPNENEFHPTIQKYLTDYWANGE